MKIPNSLEQEAFESPPFFNSTERKRFLYLPLALSDTMEALRTPTNKVCFIVMAGYFKARRKFFGKQFRPPDLEFVAHQLGLNPCDVHLSSYDKQTCARHQRLVLDHFGFSPFDAEAKSFIANEIAATVRVQLRPKLVFMEAVQVLLRQKIALPSYPVLSTLVATAASRFQRDLCKTVQRHLTDDQRKKLDALLEKEPTDHGDGWRYRLTLLKRPYQSTQPWKIKANLSDLQILQALYLDVRPVVTALALNHEGVRYYAYSVIKSRIAQVSRRNDEDRYLYLIAFVIYQTFKLNDTLIDSNQPTVPYVIFSLSLPSSFSFEEDKRWRHRPTGSNTSRPGRAAGFRRPLTVGFTG
jgi:hypothetical protein